MNKFLFILMAVVVLAAIVLQWNQKREQEENPLPPNHKNITYTIDNEPVTLVNGSSSAAAAPGSAARITTQYFGNEARGDINADGIEDIVFLVTRDGGGNGTFFYLVAAIKSPEGYRGSNAVLIGDRIAPQTTELHDGEIVVNYADRKPGEPMTERPSVGISRYFTYQNNTLIELVKPPQLTVELYYYNANKDKDAEGNIQCSRAGLEPVERHIPKTDTPIHDTLNELLKGIVLPEEKAYGFASGFPLAGVTLEKEEFADGVLTLTFTDPEFKTSGGACRASLLWMQIEETAKQFPGITSVRFKPDELFQP